MFFNRCCLLALAIITTQATAGTQPPRWVLAGELAVRVGPGPENKVSGNLRRGDQLILKHEGVDDGYCLIEGEGQYGYVVCRDLSTEKVARERAGEAGIDPATRWVSGSALNMREAPRGDSKVLLRLPLNATVTFLREDAGSGYCEIRMADGAVGFTACRYLDTTPFVMSRIANDKRPDGTPNPDYNPERVFWINPSWAALEEYALWLKTKHVGAKPNNPWPRDEALERMKAHLAKGLVGSTNEPLPDWQDIKTKAEEQSGDPRNSNVASNIQNAISIWGPLHDAISADGGAARVIALVRALEFPVVQPSLFQSEAQIAPPSNGSAQLSGRFGIAYQQLVSRRPRLAEGQTEAGSPGLYDMLARTTQLARPVQRVTLFRDGRLRSEANIASVEETLWRDVDPPECDGWNPGFSYGDADPKIFAYFGENASEPGNAQPSHSASLKRNQAGGLFAFYTATPLALSQAKRTETRMKMNRNATGFVRGIQMYFDLNADGVPDLSVWEGEGYGPGHLEGPTNTDDRWYRLVMVNISGRWKVLGSDVFQYGCGC